MGAEVFTYANTCVDIYIYCIEARGLYMQAFSGTELCKNPNTSLT